MEKDFVSSKQNKIKTKNITLMETPETDEALSILASVKYNYNYWIWGIFALRIVMIFMLTIFAVTKIFDAVYVLVVFIAISLIASIILHIKRDKFFKPYRELLKIAQMNDKIRHEERIRFRERKRLEESEKHFDNVKIDLLSTKELLKQEQQEKSTKIS
mgnify:CR=1 FL=1